MDDLYQLKYFHCVRIKCMKNIAKNPAVTGARLARKVQFSLKGVSFDTKEHNVTRKNLLENAKT